MARIKFDQVMTSERFYMMPIALFEAEPYKKMKVESKMAYGILKNRFKLSITNNWIDEEGNVYLYYTNESLAEQLNVGKDKVIRIKKELRAFGLLEEVRQGLNKPNRIYISNLSVSQVTEKDVEASSDAEVVNYDFRKSQNETSRSRKTRVQEVANCDTNYIELNKTDIKYTEFSNGEDDEDEINNNIAVNTKNVHPSEVQNNEVTNENSFGIIANLLQSNNDVQPIFHNLFEDILFNDPVQAAIALQSIVNQKGILRNALHHGNKVLDDGFKIQGPNYLLILIEQAARKQLEYMADHLVDSSKFGTYFDRGLTSRLETTINTSYKMSSM